MLVSMPSLLALAGSSTDTSVEALEWGAAGSSAVLVPGPKKRINKLIPCFELFQNPGRHEHLKKSVGHADSQRLQPTQSSVLGAEAI
jgi:hypothetical protein